MKRNITLIALLVALGAGNASAQSFGYNETNNLFYFAQRTPQVNQMNPAFFPSSNSFYLQLPTVGTQFGFPLSLGDIVYYDEAQDANIININRILDTLTDNSRFRIGLDMNLLGFGLKIGNVFVDFNTQLRGNIGIGLPMSVINTVMTGNVAADGSPIPEMTLLDGSLFNTQFYLETSIGAGIRLPIIPLTVGVHAKLLSGLFNMQMDNTRVTFETEEDYKTVRAKMYYELMAASALPLDTTGGFMNIPNNLVNALTADPLGALSSLYDLSAGNTGVAFDIGAKYEFGPLTVSASINDLSAGIHWQKNLVAFVPQSGETAIEFDGIDLGHVLNEGNVNMDTISTYLSEKLNGLSPKVLLDEGDYWYNIPTKVNLAATVNLGLLKAGVLLHGQFDRGLLSKNTFSSFNEAANDANENYAALKNTFRFNTTLSVGVNLLNWMEIIAASSFVYDGSPIGLSNFLNPGVGFIFTPATLLQGYVMLDYVSSIYLADMKAFNIKAGFNIMIGHGGKRKILGF